MDAWDIDGDRRRCRLVYDFISVFILISASDFKVNDDILPGKWFSDGHITGNDLFVVSSDKGNLKSFRYFRHLHRSIICADRLYRQGIGDILGCDLIHRSDIKRLVINADFIERNRHVIDQFSVTVFRFAEELVDDDPQSGRYDRLIQVDPFREQRGETEVFHIDPFAILKHFDMI